MKERKKGEKKPRDDVCLLSAAESGRREKVSRESRVGEQSGGGGRWWWWCVKKKKSVLFECIFTWAAVSNKSLRDMLELGTGLASLPVWH